MKFRIVSLAMLVLGVASLSSCWPVVAGAGAAAGYIAHDKGYEVRNPVTKE